MSLAQIFGDTMPAYLQRADNVLAGGGLNALSLPGGRRPVISRALAGHVWDVDDRDYVDFLLGSGPMLLGHAHPAVTAAVTDQLRQGTTHYLISEPAIELAEKIVEVMPCAEAVRYCSTGSEAVFFAMRLARAATGRDKVLKCEGAFHGNSDYALMSLTPTSPPRFPHPAPSSAGIPRSLEHEVLVAPYNDLSAVGRIVAEHHGELAAIVVEPVQRAIPPAPGFLQGVRDIASRHDIVLIFDEVVTGFRLALGGAQEYYGVVPDLAAIGKVLGGGFPLAAVTGSQALMDHAGRDAYVSGTLSGNPLGCVAALATIDALAQPGVYDALHDKSERFQRRLAEAVCSAGHDACVYGVGPMFQLHFGLDVPADYRQARQGNADLLATFCGGMIDSGVLFTGKKCYVSVAHTDDDIDCAVDTAASVAQALKVGADR